MSATSRLDATTRDDEHARPGGVDALLDEPGVLVDVVDADRIAVDGTPDRDEQLEEATGHRRQAVDRDVAGSAFDRLGAAGVAGDALARVGARDRRPDREAPATELGGARVDDPAVARPDVDPADLARERQLLELGVDRRVAGRSEVEAGLLEPGST